MGEVSFQRSDCETLGEIFICLNYANRFYGTKKSHKKNMEIFSIFRNLTTMEIKFRQLYLDT